MISKDEILKLEKQCWKDAKEFEYWHPHRVLRLINEIKRLNGWKVLKRPPLYPSRKETNSTEFDFSEITDEI